MSNKYDINRLFDLLEENNDIDFEQIYRLVDSDDSEIRRLVAELLERDFSGKGEDILIKLSDDPDELVRAEACDSLCHSTKTDVLSKLLILAQRDKSEIVRSYALLSYWDVYANINGSKGKTEELVHVFQKMIGFENSEHVKIICYTSLYLCGRTEFLRLIVKGLGNKDYHIRNLAADSIKKICSDSNIDEIQRVIKPFCDKEKVGFIKNKMNAILSYDPAMLKNVLQR